MKISNIIIAALLISFSFMACDKVEAPYKEEKEIKVNRKVLLEDFTGHKCVNCPNAHDIAHDLQELYGEDNLIVIATHAGFFSTPSPGDFAYDFRTEAGTEWADYYGIQNYPSGLVDRVEYGGSPILDKDQWGAKVDEEFKKEAAVKIEIESSLSDRKLGGDITLTFAKDLGAQAKIQILITEDNIVKPQVIPGGQDDNYVHMHVMRSTVNGSWGENLGSATYQKGDTETISFSDFSLGEDWVSEELTLIAFVYDEESGEVLQVEKKQLISDEKPEITKKVLLEDFTGHKCVNCPNAHEIAHNLQNLYGEEDLIVVAIHAGFFSTPSSGTFEYDFRTEAGTEWADFYGIQNYPSGLVDRVEYGGSPILDKDQWGAKVDEEFSKSPSLGITIDYSLSGSKLNGDISLEFVENISKQAKIQILITEDNIVKPQVIPGGQDENYVHMHVMRAAVNGSWGEVLSSATYSIDETESIHFTDFNLGSDWVTNELSIIAYVYDEESGEVLQVEKKKIVD